MRAASLVLPVVLVGGMCGQELLTDTACSKIQSVLPSLRETPPLECQVESIRPQLNYAFRFQAGYFIEVPLRQFAGKGNTVRVAVQVAPSDKSRPPACFVQAAALPEVPVGTKAELQLFGMFYLGEGSYEVDLTVVDQAGRLSRQNLTITAARRGRERRVPLRLAPGAVQPIYLLGWKPRPSDDGSARRRLTVLFHAASLYGPRTALHFQDTALLLSSLSTVLSEGAFDEVRLVAFNLDQQRELFRQDRFDQDGFRKLAETLLALKLYTVPSDALKPKAQDREMLDSLVRGELSAERPADAILFLGPNVEDVSKWKDVPCEDHRSGPRFFYFQHRINWAVGDVTGRPIPIRPAEVPDTLERLVLACSGEVYRIHNPAELEAAIEKMNAHVR